MATTCAAAGEPPSAAFAPRSGPRGKTLFTILPSERTGVTARNDYDDPRMWRELYHEFNGGPIGTGIAIGDFDGDGRPDIFVVSKTGPNHLYRNLGDFHFEDVTARAGVAGPLGAWKEGAAFADVNNDGRLDLYVCRFGAPNLLYINQGDGTFREEAAARGLALVDASNMAAFCDYDRDGWLDVFVQTNLLDAAGHPNGQRNHLFHNNRDGTFTEVTAAAGISGEAHGHSAVWWDFDEDGWPDLYVANDFQQPDQLWHNNHDGTFTNVISAVVPHMPHFSMGSDVADVNNDGHLDLLVADMAASTRVKDHRGMATLRNALPDDQQYPGLAPQYMQNALLLGTGTGRMLEAARLAGLATTDWTFGVRLEDLDLDGRVDVLVTNGMAREFHNADLVRQAAAATSEEERIRVMKSSPVFAERHLVFRNLGDLRFEEAGEAWGLDQTGVAFGSALGDLDGDGDLDLVYANYDGTVTIARNDADSGHALEIDLHGTTSNRFGVGAVVRIETAGGKQMRLLTLARGYQSTSEPMVHFGVGASTSVNRLIIEWPSGRRQEFHDLPADRRYAITEPPADSTATPPRVEPLFAVITREAGLNVANHERPFDESTLQLLVPFRFNRPGPSVAVADFDRDGAEDVVIGGVSGEPGQFFSNLGDGHFVGYGSKAFESGAALADGPVLAFDFNGDGFPDLLVTKAGDAAPADSSTYDARILLNDGHGRFNAAPDGILPPLPISVGAVAAADFEHSGHPGVFIGGRLVPGHYPDAPRSALLAWREGRFVEVTDAVAPGLARRGMVTVALWSDVDGDGWPDLLVAYDWGPVACYRNVDGKRFEDVSEKLGFTQAGNGWWRSIVAADFNGDGRPDYVVGNIGLNTRYHASPDQPVMLYSGVTLNGSVPQIVEAQLDQGIQYPLRPRDALARAFPSIPFRFPRNDAYARATFDEVFPASALSSAKTHETTELRSGIFLSQPGGTYRFSPLPRLAQIAPIHGMVAADFDGDGHTDLVVVGNWHGPVPETGRFDGGLGWLLRGDGKGGFSVVPAEESGIVVPGDARAAVLADFDRDDRPEILVTRSGAMPILLHDREISGRHSLAVSLQAGTGNPTAIGARVTLELADGTTQSLEVSAGSGYFSQSSPTLFFGWPDTAPPARIRIRWPNGSESKQSFSTIPPMRLIITSP
ncbi:MAG TPA: FG-GAP-like repeat-containing protein [Candidatus Didemnitutus sp.]|nr:FG-GAP-like repeat-containing protein [Candidatus Didemnitutus sp.]